MNEQLEADRLEASSIRYGVWVRVAYLSSGNWAIYYDEEDGGGKETGVIQIFPSLDPEYLRALSINEQTKIEERRQSNLARLEAKTSGKPLAQTAQHGLEEMGL